MPTLARDPYGDTALYSKKLTSQDWLIGHYEEEARGATDPKVVRNRTEALFEETIRSVVLGYAAGRPLEDTWRGTEAAFPFGENALAAGTHVEGPNYFQPFCFSLVKVALSAYAIFAITVCMAPTQASLTRFFSLVIARDEPEELFDRLARVFDPARPLARAYPKIKWASDWTKPVRAALARPADARAAALGACMKAWPALMRPYGLKTKPLHDYDLFPYFAFEIALAVCAYDIDDSGFRAHPFYPRELVDHYRTHIRATRDAARPIGIDPGMPEIVVVRAPRADLAKSKRKGLARWVELVTSGDSDAVQAVIEKVGKPRKVADVWELMCALTEDVEYAVQADVKDDDSVAAQAEALAASLALGEFVPPEEPPAGAARVEQVLHDLAAWLGERGQCLVAIENDDDAVHAVVVAQAHLPELLELSARLGIRANTPSPCPT